MITIWASAQIEDLQTFLGVFATAGAQARRHHGSLRSHVYRVPDEPRQIRIMFEWDSREGFEAFLNDPEVRATMQASGTVGRPEYHVLEPLADLPA